MRITKHRGKREDNGEWVYGAFYPIKDEDVYFIINNCKSIDFEDDDTTFNGYKVHKKSVGEFTGLHDKNGKEIFEGDIISYSNGKIWKNNKWDNNYDVFEVIYKDYCFQPFNKFHLGKNFYKSIEIIGNIYENAELVKL